MTSEFNKFLGSVKTESAEHTHVSMVYPKGKYSIIGKNLHEFLNLYSNLDTIKFPFGIAEKPGTILPIIVDIDIKVKYTRDYAPNEKLYSQEQLEFIVKAFQQAISETVIGLSEENLYCFVLEKEPYHVDKYTKNGFHLHFPYTKLEKQYISKWIISKVKELMKATKLFENLVRMCNLKDSSFLIDEDASINKCWLMYGSRKDGQQMEPYLRSKIYDKNMEDISLENAVKNYKIYDYDNELIEITGNEDFYLPYILSIRSTNIQAMEINPEMVTKSEPIQAIPKSLPKKIVKEKPINKLTLEKSESYNDHTEFKNEIIKLLNMLKSDRVDDYSNWMEVGYALHSIKNIDCLPIWIDWSKQSEKFQEGECEKLWDKMKSEGNVKTYGTIKYFAKNDNPVEYSSRFRNSSIFEQTMKFFNNNMVAQCILHFYDNNYIYDGNSTWYELQPNNTWSCSRTPPSSLQRLIGTEFPKKIYEYIENLSRRARDCSDSEREYINKLIKESTNNIKIVGYTNFITGCVQQCKIFYEDKLINTKIDSNRYVIAFTDCLYDLKLCAPRNITPDDCIATTVGYKYPRYNQTYDKEIKQFIHSIFENKEREEYLLKTIASAILGHKRFEQFYIWSGKGANGKGTLYDLLNSTFGEYFKTIDISYFTKIKHNSSDATPELADKQYCRFLFSTEPEANEKLQVSKLKEITGGDIIHARALYKEPVSYKPQFTLFLQTNEIPNMSNLDGGIKRRLRIISFPFVFTDNPVNETHRKSNPRIKEEKVKSDEWRDAFILLLLDVYKNFIKDADSIPMPGEIEKDTSEYLDSNNLVLSWINDFCEKGDGFSLKAKIAYESYIAHTGDKISDSIFGKKIRDNGIEKIKARDGMYYKGIRIKNEGGLM